MTTKDRICADDILGAVARGWCHAPNAGKEMDADLAIAISAEVLNLFERAMPAAAPDATPPAIQKVPLTDEQIDKCVEAVWGSFAEFDEVRLFTRQIEAIHGIAPTGTQEAS